MTLYVLPLSLITYAGLQTRTAETILAKLVLVREF